MSLAGELQDITAMWVTPPLSRAAGPACVFHNRFSSASVHLSSSIPNLQRLGLPLVAEQDCHTRASHLPTATNGLMALIRMVENGVRQRCLGFSTCHQ